MQAHRKRVEEQTAEKARQAEAVRRPGSGNRPGGQSSAESTTDGDGRLAEGAWRDGGAM